MSAEVQCRIPASVIQAVLRAELLLQPIRAPQGCCASWALAAETQTGAARSLQGSADVPEVELLATSDLLCPAAPIA